MKDMHSLARTAFVGLIGLALSLTVTSCDSLLDVEPEQDISAEVALSEQSGFEAVLTSMYDDLQDVVYYGQYFMLYPDALADNAINLPGVARYDGPPVNAAREHLTRWGGHYDSINKANNILADLEGLDAEQSVKDRIAGETYFLRALNYFDLMRAKAYEPGVVIKDWNEGVVIRTEPTRSEDQALEAKERAPIQEVYTLIKQDLQQAITLLDGPDPLFPTVTGTDERFAANKAAAQALLAQVYLYEKSYGEAASMASNALQTASEDLSADLLTEDEYVEAFTSPTTSSAIFSVRMDPDNDGNATSVNEALSSLTYDPNSFNFQLLPTEDLIQAHEEGDVRLELFEEVEPSAGQVVTRINKYTQANGSYTDNVVVIRAAEVLLIRAEARAESGDLAGALEDLNTLRTARGLEPVSLTSKNALIEAILHQKRLELAFEGERFFDLKRRGMDIPKPQTDFEVLPYDNYRILAPIPQNALDSNPNLEQNPGY